MEATDESTDARRPSEAPDERTPADCPEISAYSTTETKTVFTESGNDDGWIATDLTLDVRQ
ncbi:hypothetical protein ACFQMA_00375 [Halosimplex aquaticum]|uniref:Uncharacterized protein n=1 Tax=Halosimplex aquaticum TaxID=3026162 RepID=A0ABD5XSZ4_9EURY|nr:hypothetical protein [Halosimplex aquaticum]